jgi:hypothetical protein
LTYVGSRAMASVASAMAEPYSSRRMCAKARLPKRGAMAGEEGGEPPSSIARV